MPIFTKKILLLGPLELKKKKKLCCACAGAGAEKFGFGLLKLYLTFG